MSINNNKKILIYDVVTVIVTCVFFCLLHVDLDFFDFFDLSLEFFEKYSLLNFIKDILEYIFF